MGPPNKEVKLTKPGTIGASQLNSRVVSSERRNTSAMIRAVRSGRRRWSVNGRATQGG